MNNYNKAEQDKLVSLLEKKVELRNIHGLDMLIKHIPDLDIEGVDHAFINKLGVYPQAQDCMNEIAKAFETAIS
ncbi:hypothetical protein [Clostridium saccharoperbutylacetonicum]|uniref:hypothetical protein n=1 Tax=Clostridium saccharoperbutylacetonicum TaxID=36745 RepID=UPI000983B92F|nr:hypothetical protein [Clostridium saccharoperbutylacetonicum]AQR96722.1 hypothetical protein CLSAP_40460 [Clostridium saccharoperbutylacetonicum]NSB32599.1 hypothetical protein [Clostridium saccharoperbutylacetonicum]